MLRALVVLCVERRLAAIFVTLLVAAYGAFAYTRTQIEAYPDVTNVQVQVIAQMSGLAPEEIERQVTVPLERALNGTPQMVQMRSESLFGLSLIWLIFEDDANSFVARARTSERLASADLPPGVEVRLSPDATPLGKIFYYRLYSDRHNLHQLRSEQEWTVARVLKQVPGVADAVGMGGFVKELHVEVDPARLNAYGLSLAEVAESLRLSNRNVGGGYQEAGEQQSMIRGIGLLTSPQDIKDIVLEVDAGTPVTVADVARVVQSNAPRHGAVGYNDEREIVEGTVLLRRGENPDAVLKGIHAKVAELNEEILPEGMRIEPMYDRSVLISKTLETVHRNMLEGFLLIAGVVWLFLRSLRASAVVAVVIPLSLLTAFSGLYLLGLPANLISMGAIDFGILVDGAVVLVERVMHEARRQRPETRRELVQLVAHAAVSVSKPTFYAMAIIIAALIPVFTLQSVEGRIFRPLALTYTFALLGALAFSLTVVPALCALLIRTQDAGRPDPRLLVWLRERYSVLLMLLLRRRSLVLVASLGLLALGGSAVARVGTEFLPELDEGDVFIMAEMPASIKLAKGQDVLAEVRSKLLEFPEVAATPTEQGRPEDGLDNETTNLAQIFGRLKPREDWREGMTTERLVNDMRESLSAIPGVSFNFSQPIKDRVEEAVSGVRGKIVLKAFGTDIQEMRQTLLAAQQALESVPGVVDLDLYRDASVPQLQIRLDRSALARSGIAIDDAAAVIETALAGRVETIIWENERMVPVRLRLPPTAKANLKSIGELTIPTATGARVPLSQLADIEMAEGWLSILREGNKRYVALKFNVDGRDMGSVVDDAIAAVHAQVTVPDGQYLVWGGEFENQQRAMARLRIIVPIAILIVFSLLCSALGTVRGAVAVLLAAPFALTGGAFGLLAAGIPVSVSAVVGFIALLGQVSLAGLLVVSAIEAHRLEGAPMITAAVHGVAERFRALLMTAFLAAFGLLPMALSQAAGSETQKPFAIVIVFGMITTLVVALVLVPVMYTLVASPHAPGSRPDPGGRGAA